MEEDPRGGRTGRGGRDGVVGRRVGMEGGMEGEKQ